MGTVRSILGALLLGAAPAALAQQAAVPAKAAPAKAKQAAPVEDEDEAIVVTGRRLPGAVVGDIPPEVQIGPSEIRSYGVSTITELLDELSPQTASGRGRGGEMPVVLLDGQRISGFAEIRDIPTEAILRVDILPEEVALKYGYRADQKVVNFVLRKRFNATTAELNGSTSTQGGAESGKAEADLLHIRNGQRVNIAVSYQDSASLKESQRDIVSNAQGRPYDFAGNVGAANFGDPIDPALSALAGMPVTVAGVPADAALGRPTLAQFVPTANSTNVSDVSPYRTLRPASDALNINAVLARTIFGNVGATINASFGATGSDSLRGLPGASLLLPAGNPFSPFSGPVSLYRYPAGQSPLTQDVAGETAHLGGTMNGTVGKWRWSLTGNYDRSDTRTGTETGIDISALQAALNTGSATLNPFGTLPATLIGARLRDRANAVSNSGNLQLVLNGALLHIPAGDVSTTLKVGGTASGFSTSSTRSGLFTDGSLARRDGSGQFNIDVPITSRRNDVLAAIGDLSVNGNIAVDQLSDFGTQTTWGYGVTWKPRDGLSLIYSFTSDDGAPTVQQLGNPQVLTPDVRVFDFTRGTTADVAQLDGGNAALKSDNRRVHKIGVTWKPFSDQDLSLTANYVTSTIRNAIATLPSPTAAIEAAFPDRFIRDDDGDLIRIDNRPVNFASESKRQLRWGINFSKPLKSTNGQKLFEEIRKLRAEGKGQDLARQFGRPPGQRPAGATNTNPAAPSPTADGAPPLPSADGSAPPPPPLGDGGGPPPGGGFGGGPGGPGPGFGGGGQGGGGRGPGGPGGRFGGGRGGGRLQFAVYHTWLFKDDILIRPGVPVLDLLNGAPSGTTGGQPQHEVEVQAGYSNNGLGARLSGKWQSATTVRGGTGLNDNDLFFSDLTTVNLRLFADLGQFPSLVKYAWARGARVTLSLNNALDQRIRVRDSAGVTPISYQPGYIDPVGRQVSISLRKLFF